MEGQICETPKTEEGGCKKVGGGKVKQPGAGLGFWRLGGLGPAWAALSRSRNYFYFANRFGQLIFKNEDDCLG